MGDKLGTSVELHLKSFYLFTPKAIGALQALPDACPWVFQIENKSR